MNKIKQEPRIESIKVTEESGHFQGADYEECYYQVYMLSNDKSEMKLGNIYKKKIGVKRKAYQYEAHTWLGAVFISTSLRKAIKDLL
jgi:hypothetical protein